ncbi:MAG: hypothetical protein LBT40_00120 [Deltaproteobacteria bacterium]|jgi:restriction endonuclease Mrr|nr:hypothetical protein [Deltaproteobacteria bacterium]
MKQISVYDFMHPIMTLAGKAGRVSPDTLEDPVIQIMELPRRLKKKMVPSGRFSVIGASLYGACHFLSVLGFLDPVQGGSYSVSSRGRDYLNSELQAIDEVLLSHLCNFKVARESLKALRLWDEPGAAAGEDRRVKAAEAGELHADELLLPILQVTNGLGTATLESLEGQVMKIVADRRRAAGGYSPVLPSATVAGMLAAASESLKAAGLLRGPADGPFRVTAEGLKLLAGDPAGLELSDLESYPTYRAREIVSAETVKLQAACHDLNADSARKAAELIRRMRRKDLDRLARDLSRALAAAREPGGGACAVLDAADSPEELARLGSLTAAGAGGGLLLVRGKLPPELAALMRQLPPGTTIVDEDSAARLMLRHRVGTVRSIAIVRTFDADAFDAFLD